MWLSDCGLVHKVSRVNAVGIPLNDRGSCEIDFVVDTGEQIVPVEIKAEMNLKAKSLRTYKEKFEPELSVRTSMADYKKDDWLINLPLYAIENITVEQQT